MSAAGLAALLSAARALSDAVTFDDSGVHGRGGNGGLLSRETIRKNDELRRVLASSASVDLSLSDVATAGLVAELRKRGRWATADFANGLDAVTLNRLADAIAAGEARPALELLQQIWPEAPLPNTTLFLRDLRSGTPS